MKVLKIFLFLLIAIVLIFLAMGLMTPAVEYGHEITVSKPIEEAWAVTQDESKYAQWLDGFKSIELISGEKGKVGSKYKVIVNPGEGQPDFEMIETVTSIKEMDHVDMHFDSDMMDFQQKISFSESGGETTIKTESEVRAKGILMRSTFAAMEMFAGAFEAQETENMEALKNLIEENTTDYYPELNEPVNEVTESDTISM